MASCRDGAAHLAGEVVALEAPGGAPLQLAHPRGLLQLLGEDLVQLLAAPLDDLPLDLPRRLLVPHQQEALQLTLAQLVELLQEDAAVEELLAAGLQRPASAAMRAPRSSSSRPSMPSVCPCRTASSRGRAASSEEDTSRDIWRRAASRPLVACSRVDISRLQETRTEELGGS
ncbi:hypothetical protein EYF80_013170 [Liparis tanakae]|uniref:Uncharacterized protein n=1 Tax=Liparis tanakae TaxID=230148 RepID=A0A4Z2IF43_9TELE|nr:hypothetical protein EYF80_013170 [Liparis tanakae]